MAGLSQLGNSLYRGDVSYNIVGRRKAWYLVSAILIILSIATLGIRGLNLGIEFKGGAEFSVPLTVANDESVSQARENRTCRRRDTFNRHNHWWRYDSNSNSSTFHRGI